MHCLACNALLTDREASRKFENWKDIPDAEERFIGLCDKCLQDTDLNYTENPNASDEHYEDQEETFDHYAEG